MRSGHQTSFALLFFAARLHESLATPTCPLRTGSHPNLPQLFCPTAHPSRDHRPSGAMCAPMNWSGMAVAYVQCCAQTSLSSRHPNVPPSPALQPVQPSFSYLRIIPHPSGCRADSRCAGAADAGDKSHNRCMDTRICFKFPNILLDQIYQKSTHTPQIEVPDLPPNVSV